MKKILFIFLLITLPFTVFSQYVSGTFGNGINFHPADSSFGLKFSTRFQTRYTGVQDIDADSYSDQLMIRRARLKFDGFVYNPNIRFKIELGFSNSDTGGSDLYQFNNTSNIIRHAVIKYRFARNWDLWFGQTKLPGNRERIISSQKLQLVERSLVNSGFTLDHDLGIQLHHEIMIGISVLREIFAISLGEGRNITVTNIGGYSYTGRLEFLPMGEFIEDGDYSGSDLEREPSGKLSVGVSYNYNDGAGRTGGQLGEFLMDEFGVQFTNDLKAIFADLIYKNKGFTVHSEYVNKTSKYLFTVPAINGSLKYKTGTGFMAMVGYLFRNNVELTGRFASVEPDDLQYSSITEEDEYTLGISRYIVDHSLKIQSDVSYRKTEIKSDFLQFRFQVEISL